MSGRENEPLEYIEGSPGECPVYKGFQLKQEWNRHESLQREFVEPSVVIHHKVTLLHFRHSISDLESTHPEVTAVKQVEYDKGRITAEFVAYSTTDAISIVL
jgi:hypothetical protein